MKHFFRIDIQLSTLVKIGKTRNCVKQEQLRCALFSIQKYYDTAATYPVCSQHYFRSHNSQNARNVARKDLECVIWNYTNEIIHLCVY